MRKRVLLAGAAVAALVVIGAVGWEAYSIERLDQDMRDLTWGRAADELGRSDSITPDVGNIQFIKNGGYSISLEKADYGANGLHLEGSVGNATQLTVQNLTVRFEATKQIGEMRSDYEKLPKDQRELFGLFGYPTIGTAQSAPIALLLPGRQANFDVTIPNVRQTKDGVRIGISFSGERYSYPF